VLVLKRDRTHRDATLFITCRDVDGVRFIFSGSDDLKGNALFPSSLSESIQSSVAGTAPRSSS
jgi:hypothetical protein